MSEPTGKMEVMQKPTLHVHHPHTEFGDAQFVGFFVHDSDDWHAQRSRVIGASEAASAAGIPGAFFPPYILWLIKTGRYTLPEPDRKMKQRFKAGHLAENTLDGLLEDELPDEVAFPTGSWVHRDFQWMGCNPDRLTYNKKTGQVGGREYKNSQNGFMNDEVPLKYVAQCEYTRGMLGMKEYTLAALYGGWEPHIWTIKPGPLGKTLVISHDTGDARLVEGVGYGQLVQKVSTFVNMMWSDTPPPLDGSEATFEYTKGRWSDIDPDKDVQVSLELAARALYHDGRQKYHDAEFRKAKSELLEVMQDAKGAYVGKTKVARRQGVQGGSATLYLQRSQEAKDLLAPQMAQLAELAK